MRFSIILLLLLWMLSSCQSTKTSDKEIISVSILPQKYLVEKIAGEKYQINVLVPPGVSPETYELTPVQMKMLSDSRAYFMTGHLTFEELWRNKFEKMNLDVRLVDVSEGLELISINFRHDDHFHHGVDPHVWVSPKSMKVLAKNMYNSLLEINPSGNESYYHGYMSLMQEIERADSILSEIFSRSTHRSFLIFHPALGYLARDYDLEQIPVEFEGKTPPPAYIQKMVTIAREKNIHSILIQKEFSMDNARSIAREIDGEIIQIDPLDENWYEQIIYIGETLGKIFSNTI